MLKIKIASVLVASVLLLGGCASKSPVNIDKTSKNNSNTISQEIPKTNESQPSTNDTNAQPKQSSQGNAEEVKPTPAPSQNTTVAPQKPVPQATNQSSNKIQVTNSSKPAPANPVQPSQPSPAIISQNGVEYLAAVEDEVLRLCNVERSKAGLGPLVMDSKVRDAARFKAQEMLTKNYFDHTSPYSGTPFDLIRNRGIQFGYAGENIQMSQGKDKSQVTAQYLVTTWMNSPGHRANILKPEFKKMGVGVAFSANGNKAYESQLFTD